jgi:hypothetical protein
MLSAAAPRISVPEMFGHIPPFKYGTYLMHRSKFKSEAQRFININNVIRKTGIFIPVTKLK